MRSIKQQQSGEEARSGGVIKKALDKIEAVVTNSRQKGKRGELEAAKAWEEATGLAVKRTAQVNGKLSADLTGVEGLHLEVKRRHRIAALDFLLQAETDCAEEGQANGGVPLVIMRQDNDTRWAVMLPLESLSDLVSILAGQSCKQK